MVLVVPLDVSTTANAIALIDTLPQLNLGKVSLELFINKLKKVEFEIKTYSGVKAAFKRTSSPKQFPTLV